jgi:hypothetical protein
MEVVENPSAERPDRHDYLLAEVSERIFDAGRVEVFARFLGRPPDNHHAVKG